ncbi:unnamed protein product, partial [marine sediment metagenome]
KTRFKIMSITLEGFKRVMGAFWKSMPTEIVVLIGFLMALSQLDFLPLPILQVLASITSVVAFGMLYVRIYNKMAHDIETGKAVRKAEVNHITKRYIQARPEYISMIKSNNKTVIQNAKEAVIKVDTIPKPEPKKPIILP